MTLKRKTLFRNPRQVLPRLAEIVEACDDLVAQIDILGEAVDDIKQTLGDLIHAKPDLNALLPPVDVKARKRPMGTDSEAKHISSVALAWEGGRARVMIDGKTVVLPRMPGLLLEILLSDETVVDGSPPRAGWHSRTDLELRLSSRAGRLVSRHALENLIHRLKGELRGQANLAEIVQTNNYGEVRVARETYTRQRPLDLPANPPPIGLSNSADHAHR
jgi:hypothetical protein